MMMAVMRQGALNLSPYPQFLSGTPQTSPKAQFPRQLCLAVSSQEEEDREGIVKKKKMSKNNITQLLATVHFKVFFVGLSQVLFLMKFSFTSRIPLF